VSDTSNIIHSHDKQFRYDILMLLLKLGILYKYFFSLYYLAIYSRVAKSVLLYLIIMFNYIYLKFEKSRRYFDRIQIGVVCIDSSLVIRWEIRTTNATTFYLDFVLFAVCT